MTQHDQVFERYVWHNPEICNNCFRRCKTITETAYSGGGDNPNHTVQFHTRTPDGTIGMAEIEHDEYGAMTTHEARTTCAQCGSVRLLAEGDVLSTREARECAREICKRLEEQGFEVDLRLMKKFINVAKRTHSFASYDWSILAGAVQHGVKSTPSDPESG